MKIELKNKNTGQKEEIIISHNRPKNLDLSQHFIKIISMRSEK